MSAGACLAALQGAQEYDRATELDAAFPGCACEAWALCKTGGSAVGDEEVIARILTSPDGYDESAETILTAKLLAIYSIGLSVVRQGASDAEIMQTVQELVAGGNEPRSLIGAAIVRAKDMRKFDDPNRWFGVYATDSNGKTHHVDVFGTTPTGTKSQAKKTKDNRRYRMADELSAGIVLARDPGDLIAALRGAGI